MEIDATSGGVLIGIKLDEAVDDGQSEEFGLVGAGTTPDAGAYRFHIDKCRHAPMPRVDTHPLTASRCWREPRGDAAATFCCIARLRPADGNTC
jgi:hypothetical protein